LCLIAENVGKGYETWGISGTASEMRKKVEDLVSNGELCINCGVEKPGLLFVVFDVGQFINAHHLEKLTSIKHTK
jgi:hypothetical protein